MPRPATAVVKRQLEELEHLHAIQSAYEQLSTQMDEHLACVAELQDQLASSLGEQNKQSSQVRTLELALAQARTQVEMQEKMNAQLQNFSHPGRGQLPRATGQQHYSGGPARSRGYGGIKAEMAHLQGSYRRTYDFFAFILQTWTKMNDLIPSSL